MNGSIKLGEFASGHLNKAAWDNNQDAIVDRNGAFCVRACNAHDYAEAVCKWVSYSFGAGFQIPAHIVADAREFLAKAKGDQS
jgi:hypothetical protein